MIQSCEFVKRRHQTIRSTIVRTCKFFVKVVVESSHNGKRSGLVAVGEELGGLNDVVDHSLDFMDNVVLIFLWETGSDKARDEV